MTDHDTPATDRDSMARRKQDGELTDLTLACTLFEYAVADRDARIATLETQAGQAYTDIAAHEERETELLVELSKAREERTQARADAAAAREIFAWMASFDDSAMANARTLHYDMRGKAQQYLAVRSPGAALLAELEAAQRVVEAAEAAVVCDECGGRGFYWTAIEDEAEAEVCECRIDFDNRLRDYKEATKARQE